jgi:hypothetical protein
LDGKQEIVARLTQETAMLRSELDAANVSPCPLTFAGFSRHVICSVVVAPQTRLETIKQESSGDSSSWKRTVTLLENKVAEANRAEASKVAKVNQLEVAMSALRVELQEKIAETNAAHATMAQLQEKITRDRESFAVELEKLRQTHSKELSDWQTRFDAADKEHASALVALKGDHDAVQALLITSHRQVDDLQVGSLCGRLFPRRCGNDVQPSTTVVCFQQHAHAALMREHAEANSRVAELKASLEQSQELEVRLQAVVYKLDGETARATALEQEVQKVRGELEAYRLDAAHQQAQETDKRTTAARQDQLLADYRRKLTQVSGISRDAIVR